MGFYIITQFSRTFLSNILFLHFHNRSDFTLNKDLKLIFVIKGVVRLNKIIFSLGYIHRLFSFVGM